VVLVGKHVLNGQFKKPRCIYEDNIGTDIKEIKLLEWRGVGLIWLRIRSCGRLM
jgi:hypothetical protein